MGGTLGALASATACGVLLSFRNRRSAFYALMTYVQDAANRILCVLRRGRGITSPISISGGTMPTNTIRPPSSSSSNGGSNAPLVLDDNVHREPVSRQQAADEHPEVSVPQGEAIMNRPVIQRVACVDACERYSDRERETLEEGLAKLRDRSTRPPPPAYYA